MREQNAAGVRGCSEAAWLHGFVDFSGSQIYQADASDDFEMLVDFVIRKEKRAPSIGVVGPAGRNAAIPSDSD